MSAPIVNHILNQLNNHPDGHNIKKLLYLKLELEFSQTRCIDEPVQIRKDESFAEIVSE